MKKQILLLLFAAAMLFASSCSFTTAHIKDVKMCREMTGDQCSDDNPVFDNDDPVIYVTCIVGNAPQDTRVTFSWYYTERDPIEIDVVSVELKDGGTFPVYSSLSAPYEGWPDGKYEVVIAIEGFEDKAVKKSFKVE